MIKVCNVTWFGPYEQPDGTILRIRQSCVLDKGHKEPHRSQAKVTLSGIEMTDHDVGYENYLARQDGIDIKSGLPFKDKKMTDVNDRLPPDFSDWDERLRRAEEQVARLTEERDALRQQRDSVAEELVRERLAATGDYFAEPCKRCHGLGTAGYGSTSTWMGGIGGQTMTTDVCDKCWGSGNDRKPWPSHRDIHTFRKSLAAKDEALRAAKDLIEQDSYCRDCDYGGGDCGKCTISLVRAALKEKE